MSEFILGDCMDYLKDYPDNYFDLAIVDPPYGGANSNCGGGTRFGGRFDRYKGNENGRNVGEKVRKKIVAWDTAPKQEYFNELFRVSRNQIIWGGNYFQLPPTRCFIVWRKTNVPEKFTMAMCEYAWTSFNSNAKVYFHSSQRDKTSGKFHPTEKPIDLYKWCLTNYAKQGDRILDTHVGSASSLIACTDMGFEYTGFEIDEEYYNKAKERMEHQIYQIGMDWRLP